MDGFITIDTLYMNVKYPHRDIFDYWHDRVKNLDYETLHAGVVYDDMVIRNGFAGYDVSVWKHDARIYLTEHVEDERCNGSGMGAWLQLGPKFLIQHVNDLHGAVKEFLDQVGITGNYPISITRLDIAVDLLGVSIREENLLDWKNNWVGRSKLSDIHLNSRTGEIETFYVGSRKSPIYLRIYDKVEQSKKDGDYEYWRDVWENFQGPVTRVEWEVKPKNGKFSENLVNFFLLDGISIRELLNYLLDWGRLCEPNPRDSNRRRWKDSSFWVNLRGIIEAFQNNINWPTTRHGKEFHGVSDAYVKLVSGVISGAMAKLEPDDPSFFNMFEKLKGFGEPIEKINKKAQTKAEIIKRI
jgi:hypothetical protein